MKTSLRPELETNASIDDVISLDESTSIDNVTLSPTHYIEKATTAAKSYLPTSAGDAVERLGSTVGEVANIASKKVTDNVQYATNKASQTRVRASSFLGTISDTIKRSGTVTSRDDLDSPRGERPPTPQYLNNDSFAYEEEPSNMVDAKSASTSSEDVRVDQRSIVDSMSIPDMEAVGLDLDNEASGADTTDTSNSSSSNKMATPGNMDKEEELCQLVINILFTIMWRGQSGKKDDIEIKEAAKERGSVIACINMFALSNNNELYMSHVVLKRRIVELCVQAVLADMKDSSTDGVRNTALAEHVMQWAYDLIVLDPYARFSRKVSESLLDGLLGLMEAFVVFAEGDLHWDAMAKMALDILLHCAEKSTDNLEICTMATAKLHALVQTRMSSSVEENGFLMFRYV